MGNSLDLENDVLFELPIKLLGENVVITETLRSTWILMGVLILFAIIVRLSVNKFDKVPKGFQNFIEVLVEGLSKLVVNTMGEKNKGFTPYFATIFIFILLANLMGLLGLRPPTADLSTTFALSTITFLMIQIFKVKAVGILGYIGSFFKPLWPMFPLNVISEVATPVSLSFRLFGNILGGMIIMTLFYELLPVFVKIGIPVALHGYFDLFAGVLQTFIFVMLSMTFVASATEE